MWVTISLRDGSGALELLATFDGEDEGRAGTGPNEDESDSLLVGTGVDKAEPPEDGLLDGVMEDPVDRGVGEDVGVTVLPGEGVENCEDSAVELTGE